MFHALVHFTIQADGPAASFALLILADIDFFESLQTANTHWIRDLRRTTHKSRFLQQHFTALYVPAGYQISAELLIIVHLIPCNFQLNRILYSWNAKVHYLKWETVWFVPFPVLPLMIYATIKHFHAIRTLQCTFFFAYETIVRWFLAIIRAHCP